MTRCTRHALTLIEVLVVLAVVSVLLGLLLPAVQLVRAAAARASCANNLRQLGLAAHQYHDDHQVFPAGMRFQGFRDPYPLAGWLVFLLPYLEQDSLWRQTQEAYRQAPFPFANPPHEGLATVVKMFVCPADGRAATPQLSARTHQRIALTSYLGVSGTTSLAGDGMLFKDSRIRFTDVLDGTSSTLFAGERPASTDFQFGWWYAGAGQRFTGSADSVLGVVELNFLEPTINSCPVQAYSYGPGSLSNQCDLFHFWSLHQGGSHFLFVDGSVRFLAYPVASVLPALATRAGGEVVPTSD